MAGLFPAHAGVILEVPGKVKLPFAFPRACGGDPSLDVLVRMVKTFSPRMRG